MSKSERWSSASSDSDVSFVLFGGNVCTELLYKSLSNGVCIWPVRERLVVCGRYRRYKWLYDMISIRRCNIAHISRYTGEHRGEIQGSNAIHEILKERIAFLSGTWQSNNIMFSYYIVTIGDM